MPLVAGPMIDRLMAAFDPEEGRAIVMPTFRGKQGNPMLWAVEFLPEMMAITGDVGARHLAGKHADRVAEVEMADDAVLRDFDTTDALASLRPVSAGHFAEPGRKLTRAGLRSRSLAVPVFRGRALPGRCQGADRGCGRLGCLHPAHAGSTTSSRSRSPKDSRPRRMA